MTYYSCKSHCIWAFKTENLISVLWTEIHMVELPYLLLMFINKNCSMYQKEWSPLFSNPLRLKRQIFKGRRFIWWLNTKLKQSKIVQQSKHQNLDLLFVRAPLFNEGVMSLNDSWSPIIDSSLLFSYGSTEDTYCPSVAFKSWAWSSF